MWASSSCRLSSGIARSAGFQLAAGAQRAAVRIHHQGFAHFRKSVGLFQAGDHYGTFICTRELRRKTEGLGAAIGYPLLPSR